MREILFRAKSGNEWVYGDLVHLFGNDNIAIHHAEHEGETRNYIDIIPKTVGQYTGLTDKNGKKIFEGDIVQYQNFMEFDIQSVVKFGEYKQDGSSGEYGAIKCLGFYVEVDNFTCPDWCENQPEYFNDYWVTENLLQVNDNCEVIGNIHDNPELLKGGAE